MHSPAHKCAAVEEDWRIVKRLSRAVVSLRVGYAKVLDASVDELLPEHLLKCWIPSILLRLCCHVVAILDLLFLSLSEPIKVRLKSTRFQPAAEAEKLSFGLFLFDFLSGSLDWRLRLGLCFGLCRGLSFWLGNVLIDVLRLLTQT